MDEIEPELIAERMAAMLPHAAEKGVLSFNGSKWAKVDFLKPFLVYPVVCVGVFNTSSTPDYTVSVSRTHFTISFSEEWTGSISWRAEV